MSNKDVQDFVDRSMRKRTDPEKNTIVVIDETGNAGLSELESEKIFATTATILSGEDEFGRISEKYRKILNVDEIKYLTAPKETKGTMVAEIRKIDHRVTGVYIDKTAGDNPIWWYRFKKHRSKAHKRMMEELSGQIMDEDMNELTVIIDEHTAYKRTVAKNILLDAAKDTGKTIEYIEQENSEDGTYKDLLQTNDILIGDIGHSLRKGRPLDERVNMRRLTKDNEKEG